MNILGTTVVLLLLALLSAAPATAQDTANLEAAAAGKPTSSVAAARDELQLDSTNVTGNRELPRVMVIVPWKRSAPGALAGRPLNSLMDEILTPIDREVFVRRQKYYDGLRTASETKSKP